ncbi:glycosyltransferase [Caldibacillus lycopersici]|uniref:Glycosyltransferase n=1 Tax=Perspicuibacillus lycopersici TaxID=1325689 RepID=A0AAE3ITX6_9BACI|nr:glycosyltransferase [Perspicuibacillus lycopersici]MCU9614558.1 glycosyltransferase [Perspicuibacillus lycopersici]
MNTRQPLVSVIIPFYNCQYVNQAIESVRRQTYKNIEIIVVNDGSTMYTELVKPYLSQIIYLEQENKGVAAALNKGLKHAKGDYIAWLSSDDLFDEKKVETQLELMLNNLAEISFTNFNIIDEHNKIINFNVGKHFTSSLEFVESLKNYCPINGCTIMMSKKLVQRVGLFDETLKYTQDYDYWIRAALQATIHYYHITLTNYRVHKKMGSVVHRLEQMEEFKMIKEKYRQDLERLITKTRMKNDV